MKPFKKSVPTDQKREVALNFSLQFFVVALTLLLCSFQVNIFAIQVVFGCSLALVTWYAFRIIPFPSFFHWFVLAYVPMFMLYPITLPLFGEEFPTTENVLLSYTFLSIIGIHLFLLGYEIFRNKNNQNRIATISHSFDFSRYAWIIWVLLGIIACSILLRASEIGTLGDVVSSSRNEIKEEGGLRTFISGYILNSGVILFALLPAFLGRARWSLPLLIPTLLVMDVLLFLYSRARAAIIMHLVSFVMGWLFFRPAVEFKKQPAKKKKRVHLTRRFFIFLTLFLTIALFGAYLRVARTYISSEASISELTFYDTVKHAFIYGEFGFAPTVFEVLEVFPEHEPLLFGQSYYRLIFVPIPRSIWPNKPLSTARHLGQVLRPEGHEHQTNTAGVIGDLYINFGFFGVLGMFVFGALFALVDRKQGIIPRLLLCCSFVPIFNIVRGAFTGPILVIMSVLFSSYLVIWLTSATPKKIRLKTKQLQTSDNNSKSISENNSFNFSSLPS